MSRGRRAVSWPIVTLGLCCSTYIAVFGFLTWRQQSDFGTFGFDMGIYDQGIWLLSRFKRPFVTVRGLNYFGHHVNPITVLLVPFYWLGGGPHLLYAVETVVMALGAVPVWLLARDRLASQWAAVALAAAYLLYPSLEWINWWHFHPDALSIPPLLFAYWLSTRGRWGWFTVAVVVALLCKEDAALAVLVLGLLIAARGERRRGLLTAVAGAAWFAVATRIIIPHANGGAGPFYETFFPGFGHTLPEIAWNLVRHPSRFIRAATGPGRGTYYLKLLAPVGFVPLLALPVLLIGAPQVAINVTTGQGYAHDIKYHYSSLVVAAVFLAAIEGCAWITRRGLRRQLTRVVALFVLGAALASNLAWSPSPLGHDYRRGTWVGPSDLARQAQALVDHVPPGQGVSATYYLVPHLTHRVEAYEWPNPWIAANWAINGEHRPSPRGVHYLALDTNLLDQGTSLYSHLLATGEFRVVFRTGPFVLARRSR